MSRAESNHSIVAATIRLHGRFAPNRPRRPANRHTRIDRQMLVNNSDVLRDLARAIDNELRESAVSPTGEVDCMVSMFTEKGMRTATRLLHPPHGEHRHTDGVRMRTCAGSWMRHGTGGRKHRRRGGSRRAQTRRGEDRRSSRAWDGCSNVYNAKVCRGFSMPTPEASKDGYGRVTLWASTRT